MNIQKTMNLVVSGSILLFLSCAIEPETQPETKVDSVKTETSNNDVKPDSTLKAFVDTPCLPTENEKIKSLQEVTNGLKSRTANYNFDADRDTTIVCSKGTKIAFSANTLVHKDGSVPKGKVELSVKECYTLADFLGDNLVTLSGDRLLETGGMVEIHANADGKELTMKPGTKYDLSFPNKGTKKPGMKTFYGKSKGEQPMDWVLAKQEPNSSQDKSSPTQAFLAGNNFGTQEYFAACGVKIIGRTVKVNNKTIEWKLKNSPMTIDDYIKQRFKPSDKLQDDLCVGRPGVDMIIRLSLDGIIISIKFIENEKYKEFENEISTFLMEMPALNMASHSKSYGGSIDYSLVLGGSYQYDPEASKKHQEEKEKKFNETYANKDEKVKVMAKSDLDYYVQSAAQFGWINCDRFYDSKEEKTDYYVEVNSPNDTKVMIAFKDINCIMQGTVRNNKVVFANIPVNQEIKVIGITYSGTKPSMGVADARTGKTAFQLNKFQDFTLNELKQELSKLN